MKYLILILALFLSSCSDDKGDDAEIFAGEQDSKIVGSQPATEPAQMTNAATGPTYKYFNVGDGGRMAWRIPVKGTVFGRSFVVRFSNGYAIRVPNSARRCSHRNGFTYRPGIGTIKSGTGTSHGGVYIYAPRGNKSQTLTILR